MPESANFTAPYDRGRLRQILSERFNESELKTIAYDLGVDYGGLPGSGTAQKAVELLTYFERRQELDRLVAALIESRDDLDAADFRPPPAIVPPPEPIDDDGTPPFMGLRYFDVGDAPLFFGRKELASQLLQRLYSDDPAVTPDRFLAVVGASGSGKSSLVRAGLIPIAREKWGNALREYILTPTERPLRSLANRLTEKNESVLAAGKLMDDMVADDRSLDLYLDRLLEAAPQSRILIVVDQFEELFTPRRDKDKDEEPRRAFIDNLLTAAEGSDRVSVVITLRADFYAHCARYDRLRPALEQQQAYIGAMDEDDLRRAITGPAVAYGLAFDSGLVDEMLRDVRDEPGGLPLLSHALLETWKRREGNRLTFAGYYAAGGVEGAIAKTAEDVYRHKLSPAQQAIARNIFVRLTELGEGTQDTRRRAELGELVPDPAQADMVASVLQLLVAKRLITADRNQVEVAHEALIREWPTLRGWLEEDREGLRIHRHLTQAAREWEAMGRVEGELYRGLRLAQAQEWVDSEAPLLNELEREFLAASQAEATRRKQDEERRAQEREAARQRELESAQELAAERRQRLKDVRRRSVILAVVAVLAVVAAGFAFWQTQVANQRTQEARGAALAAGAQQELANGDVNLALALALEAIETSPSETAWEVLWQAAAEPAAVQAYLDHDVEVNAIAVSPDGNRMLSASSDHTMILWEIATGEALHTFKGHSAGVQDVAWSPDSKIALSASRDGTVKIWNVATGEVLSTRDDHATDVLAVAISPDGQWAASGDADGVVLLWDLPAWERVASLPGHSKEITSLAFSPDGMHLLSSSRDFDMHLWDVATQEMVRTFNVGSIALEVAFSPDGQQALSADSAHDVKLWNVAGGQRLRTFEGHGAPVYGVAFSADGRLLLSGGGDNEVIVWDRDSGMLLQRLRGHMDAVWDVAFTQAGPISASRDDSVRLWRLARGQQLLEVDGVTGFTMALSPDGKTALVDAVNTGDLVILDLANGQSLGRLSGHGSSIYTVTFSPDGRQAVSGDGNGELIWWDLESLQALYRIAAHDGIIREVAYSPDGATLLSASEDGRLILWDVATGQQLRVIDERDAEWNAVAIHPGDGDLALAANDDREVILWRLDSGEVEHALTGHGDAVVTVAISPDGAQGLSGDLEGNVILWDLADGRRLHDFRASENGVRDVVFSPDGALVLAAGQDKTISVWEAASGTLLHRFYGHEDMVSSLAVYPDGDLVVSSSLDGTLRVWPLPDSQDDFIAWVATNRYIPELTCEQREQYGLSPCEEGIQPTRRSYPTTSGSDWTPIPTSTPSPTVTPAPTATPQPPQPITFGETVSGNLAVGARAPWTFTAQAGDAVAIDMRAENGDLDTFFELLDPAGVTLVSNDDGGEETDSLITAFVLPETGTYTIIASSYLDQSAGAYTLVLQHAPAPEPTATPLPTATPQPPRPIAFGETVNGRIVPGARVQWTFTGQAGEVVTIDMRADGSRLDSYLELLDPAGQQIASDDDSGGNRDALINAFVLPDTGTYTVIARSFGFSSKGAYSLTLSRAPAPTATP